MFLVYGHETLNASTDSCVIILLTENTTSSSCIKVNLLRKEVIGWIRFSVDMLNHVSLCSYQFYQLSFFLYRTLHQNVLNMAQQKWCFRMHFVFSFFVRTDSTRV